MRILLVEDEKKVSSFIKKGLEEEFYSVDAVYDGKNALSLVYNESYDLIILDLMLPIKDGVTVLKEIRKNQINSPVLILTAKDSIDNKIEGLDSGADDYLTKPFAFEELLARVRALLRRNSVNRSVSLKAADMTLDAQTHKVKRGLTEIILTPKEYSILEYLMRNKNRIVSRTILTEHVYDYQFDPDTNVIDVYINKLRNKIDKGFEKQLLYTVRGAGYMIKDE
jgi:DNA-binding response OmpR family regulator